MKRFVYLTVLAACLAGCDDLTGPSVEGPSERADPGRRAVQRAPLSGALAAVDVTDLGAYHGGWSEAFGINAAGQIVGWSNYDNFLRDPATGTLTWLGNPFGDWNAAYDINNHGQVVGRTAYVGWVWDPDTGAMRGFHSAIQASETATGSVCGTTAHGINDLGQVVGAVNNCAHTQAFEWDTATDGHALAPTGMGEDINDEGLALLNRNAGDGGHAFVWDPATGSMQDLGSLGGLTQAYALNDAGQVVGSSVNGSGHARAFLWDPQTQALRDLGTLGGTSSEARGINGLGQVAGWSHTASGERHAFLWDPETEEMLDLGALPGGTESGAYDLNDGGQVVGYSTVGGQKRATLWTVTLTHNSPPSADAGGPYQALEGDAVAFDGSASGDPDGDALTYAWDFGDGSSGSGARPTHVYASDGAYAVTLVVTDAQGEASAPVQTAVTVANVPAALGAVTGAPLVPVPLHTPITVTVPFTDPGVLDEHTAAIDWNKNWQQAGSDAIPPTPGTVTEAAGAGSASGTYAYTQPGVYTIEVTVQDDDASSVVSYQYVVVYDPSAGFVTGGGWIASPAGAYAADPAATGKASFGFVARYHKAANVPSGTTQFMFSAKDFRFHSVSYEWLVVAGAKAQYRGRGRVNGEGDYGFLLTAVDGQVSGGGGTDRFRLKVWERSSGQVVYDNQHGDAEDAPPATALGGGSITVHRN